MRFHDRHERLTYLKAAETARRVLSDPALIGTAIAFVQRFMAPDPHQSRYTAVWLDLLGRSPADIAAALLADTEQGRLLRETCPVFGKGLTSREVVALMEQADAAAV